MAKSGEAPKILISNNAPTLAAITYLRTVIKIKKYSNYKSQEENLLKLAPPHSTDWCGTSGYETALKFILTLQNEGFDSDYHLPLESKTETYALLSLIRDKLVPVILFYQYLDIDNYKEVTRPKLQENLSSFLEYFNYFKFPSTIQKFTAKELADSTSFLGSNIDLENLDTNNEIQLGQVKEKFKAIAESALSTISGLFLRKSGPFWFGQEISTLDCILYSYLAVIRGNPWVSKDLYQILSDKCRNLCVYIDNVHKKVYPTLALPSSSLLPDYDYIRARKEKRKNIEKIFQVLIGVAGAGFLIMAFGPTFIPAMAHKAVEKKAEKKAENRAAVSEDEPITAL